MFKFEQMTEMCADATKAGKIRALNLAEIALMCMDANRTLRTSDYYNSLKPDSGDVENFKRQVFEELCAPYAA